MKRFVLSLVSLVAMAVCAFAQADLNGLSNKDLNLLIYTTVPNNSWNETFEKMGSALDMINEMLVKNTPGLDKTVLDGIKDSYLKNQFQYDLAEVCGIDEGLTRQEKIKLISTFRNPVAKNALEKMNNVDGSSEEMEAEIVDVVMNGKMPELKTSAKYAKKYSKVYDLLGIDVMMSSLGQSLGIEDKDVLNKLLNAFPVMFTNLSYDSGITLADIKVVTSVIKKPEYQKMLKCTYNAIADPEALGMGIITRYAKFLEASGIE